MNATYQQNGTWHGRPLYECSACAYSAVSEREILVHVAAHNQAATVSTGLVDSDGRPITREPTEEENHGATEPADEAAEIAREE